MRPEGVSIDAVHRGGEPGDGLATTRRFDHRLQVLAHRPPWRRLSRRRDWGDIAGSLDHLEAFPAGRIPDPHRLVARPADDAAAVGGTATL